MYQVPFTVTTLGTGAALPARGRYPTSQLVNVHGAWYMIDCGEGTQERLRAIGFNFQRIGHIFISHLHGDHYLGLTGLLYSRPSIPPAVGRSALGLPEQGTLMLMPQSLFKVHPQMDVLMAEVLAACPQARLVLFDLLPQFRQPFERRLRRSLSQHEVDPARLIWLTGCDRERYLQINMACDFMLDSLHFSGGNTSLDAFQAGLPVLSSEGTFMRGRQTAAMLRRLGLNAHDWLS